MVLFHTKAYVTQYLSQQGADYDLSPVVWDNNDTSLMTLKGIMAAFTALPLETRSFSYPLQFLIRDQRKSGQAQASTRQVPTKSGNGSSGSAVFKYAEIASCMFDSSVGRSGA